MSRNYIDAIARGKARHGERFSDAGLAPQFRRYFETGQRIKVRTGGMELTGTVGITTGWVPAFLLMRTTRSVGSSFVLGDRDEILAVRRGRTYVEVSR